ncbi:glycosyl hydrolase 115 family protein [Coraliomargarita sp. SDUM461003]|uniref:Glycosyl hydrolase 115 family protein n=1 Tax=Thalassobacterium maritimum TaxID=3041265 RepID=A0ABU1AQG4_9BACT|nr:glycosyl hydrolase 115 family protein [Coraliomargarita sp. SDUM461003]MDQ8206346.1 glycosyl hydrolase 115 family protein [Coraliomargarita sp. SDUM461003]
MHPPEADMIRAAIRRGLYVSQHHIEPLGVSHFAYESWWARQGKSPEFSYRQESDAMRTCWRAYAERWQAIAGEQLIWQVGLRGRGDRPLWNHDPKAQARAGEFIASALEGQMAIIRSIDPRPKPPATLTLWYEGAKLISKGQLKAPKGVSYIFADHSRTQEMQDDFLTLPRESERPRGYYYHVAVWSMGPHLVSGPPPEKIARTVQQLVEKGDTYYALLNVSNLREHTMGTAVWTQQVWQPEPLTNQAFLKQWSSPELAPLHAAFLDSIPQFQPEWRFYDGSARLWIDRLISSQVANGTPLDGLLKELVANKRAKLIDTLQSAVDALDHLLLKVKAQEATISHKLRAYHRSSKI